MESRIFRIAMLVMILISVVTVFVTVPHEEDFRQGADEGTYFNFAKVISRDGTQQIPFLLERFFDKKRFQLFPNPMRVGHTMATALWFKVFPDTFVSLARFSFLCWVLLLAASFYFLRKFFSANVAAATTMLLSCSPLLMTSGRRALQDSDVNLFWVLAVFLFFDFLLDKKKRKFFLFVAVFSWAILVKESNAVLAVFFVLISLVHKFVYKEKLSGWYIAGAAVLPLLVALIVFMAILGDVHAFKEWIQFMLGVHFTKEETNPYNLLAQGPWYKYLIDYLILNPLQTLLAIGYFFHILFTRKFQDKAQVYFATYFLVIFAIFNQLRHTKIVRFVAGLEPVISLFAALALWELFRNKDRRLEIQGVLRGLVFIFFVNYYQFFYLFVIRAIYDPSSTELLAAVKMILEIR